MSESDSIVRELRGTARQRRSHGMFCEGHGRYCWCRYDPESTLVEAHRVLLQQAADEIERANARADRLYEACVDAHDHLSELTGPDAPYNPRVLSADARLREVLAGVSR